VTVGAARVQSDDDLADALAGYAEFAGFPLSTPWTKRYGFGLIPVGDAFIAWSKVARPWISTVHPPAPAFSMWSLATTFLVLGVIAVAPWLPYRSRALTLARARARARPRAR
jgi:hypothetical protein